MENSILKIFGSVDVKITPELCSKMTFYCPQILWPSDLAVPEKGILESLEFQYVLGNPGDLTVQTFTELKVAGTGYNI